MPEKETLHENSRQSIEAAIIVFGEVLFDCFESERRVLGGAPFNVAWGLKGFGEEPAFVSAVGDDADGLKIEERMGRWGLSTEWLQTQSDKATGEVYVTVKDDEPSYEICEDRAWDCIDDDSLSATQYLYHGSLALRSERSRSTLKALIKRSRAKRFFDVNLRPPYDDMELIRPLLHHTDWLKLNIDELTALTGQSELNFQNAEESIRHIRDEYSIKNVLLTGGRMGAQIQGEYGNAFVSPAPNPEPFVDTVGAGDAFSARTLSGLLAGTPVEKLVEDAGLFAARVCGLNGATTSEREFYQK